MPESILRVLADLGVPAAITAAAAMTFAMRPISDRFAKVGATLTLLGIAAYLPIQLYPQARDAFAPIQLRLEPAEFRAFKESGEPTRVVVSAVYGDTTVEQKIVPAADPAKLSERSLQIERHESEPSFLVSVGANKIGQLRDAALKARGWSQSIASTGGCERPNFIYHSAKVYRDQTWAISGTPYGDLRLKFHDISGTGAIVSVSSGNLAKPSPATVVIPNKAFDTQSYSGQHEILIQVHSADFTTKGEEWARFAVIGSSGASPAVSAGGPASDN